MGLLEWLKDRWNDDTIDDAFIEMEEEFLREWRIWAQENKYDILDKIPDDILKASQKSPYIECDKVNISFPLEKKHGQHRIYSYYIEKEFDSFFSSSIHTYNCLVAAVKFNIGEGVIDVEAELEGIIGGGKRSIKKIESNSKRYIFKINGEPEKLINKFFNSDISEQFRSFDEVHMSYINGFLFLIRPMPRLITRPRIKQAHNPLKFDPGVDSILEIGSHRRWDNECVIWIGQIIDRCMDLPK